ncbi:MAG: hypothetical protein QXE81_04920 [Desulfurococcaceae archaeon]
MNYSKELISIIVVIMIAVSMANSHVYAENEYNNTYVIEYGGSFILNLYGEEVIKSYIDVINFCNITLNQVLLAVNFFITLRVEFVEYYGIITRHVNISIHQVSLSHQCLYDYVYTLSNNSITNASLRYIPIELGISENELFLKIVNITGDMIGVTRFNYDVVHISYVSGFEDTLVSRYVRKDLYYEPLSNIPVHYSYVAMERNINGYVQIVYYVSLSNEPELFRNIVRKVYEVRYLEKDINKTSTLIILYYSPNKHIEPLYSFMDRNISIVFSEPTRCFVQIGAIKGSLDSNIEFTSYNTTTGTIYLSKESSLCSEIYISLQHLEMQDVFIEEEKEYPEKGLPPKIPSPTLADLVSAMITLALLLLVAYIIVNFISRRLIKVD